VPAAADEEAMRDAEASQVGGELPVLSEQAVVGAGVEPETRPGRMQRRRSVIDLEQRAVRREAGDQSFR